ncbi:MAG: lipoate--protein ligase family protein [Gemmatimonadetes bacterium]|nr:lipoate--protein ligase family protein [Gemmatimonadota bacterium]
MEPDGQVWRLIVHQARDGATNMAIDDALFESVQAGGRSVLRLYHWDPPCVSLGRNQLADASLAGRARSAGATLVRRPTGGLAVYHDREVTYAAIGTVCTLGRPREAYARINRALVTAARRLGAPASLAPSGRAPSPGARLPCFAEPAPGEVVVGSRKLVGSAQRCVGRVILQHGSILLDGDQEPAGWHRSALLAAATSPDHRGDGSAPFTLREAIGRMPERAEVQAAVVGAFETEFGCAFAVTALEPAEQLRATELTAHYASEAWTWRR